MARLVNVVRRQGTYHFRRVVPAQLRARVGLRELTRSHGTKNAYEAKLRADLLYRVSEQVLAAAASPMLPEETISRLVRRFYDHVLTLDNYKRLLNGPLTDADCASHAAYLDDLLVEHRGALARNAFGDIEPATSFVLAMEGTKPENLSIGELNQINQALLRAGIDVTRQLRARFDGDFTQEPKDRMVRAALSRIPEPPAPTLFGSLRALREAPVQGEPQAGPPAAPRPGAPTASQAILPERIQQVLLFL